MPSNLGIANAEELAHALSIVASGNFLHDKTLALVSGQHLIYQIRFDYLLIDILPGFFFRIKHCSCLT